MIIALPALLAETAGAEPLEFREFKMGMTRQEVESKIKKDLSKREGCFKDMCSKHFDIKGVPVDALFIFTEDTLNEIGFAFKPTNYKALKDALIEKYGKPTQVEKELLQNNMGATFEGESASWKMKNGEVIISQYNGSTELGSILMHSPEYIKQNNEKRKDDKAKPGF